MASGLHAKSNISATRGRIDLSFFLFESYNAQVSSPKFSALYDISNLKKCRSTFKTLPLRKVYRYLPSYVNRLGAQD